MVCFEVYRNDEKLSTAGVGEFGILNADVLWLSHEPEKLARWAAEGRPYYEPTSMKLNVGGADWDNLKWLDVALSVGDEIRIRIVDLANPDPPAERIPTQTYDHLVEEISRRAEEAQKDLVRRRAADLGWEIRE